MHRYTDHGGPEHTPMKDISRLKNLQDGAVFVVFGFRAIHGLMQVRIK